MTIILLKANRNMNKIKKQTDKKQTIQTPEPQPKNKKKIKTPT